MDKYLSRNGKIIFFVIVAIAIAAAVYFSIVFLNKDTNQQTPPPSVESNIQKKVKKEDKATVTKDIEVDEIDQSTDKRVSFTVEDYGRSNPFLPKRELYTNTRQYGFDLITPPEKLSSETTEAARVMSTKISGIMFEPNNPSAILNVEGVDYLVRSGDYINNYKVLSIEKDVVTVQLGANVYKVHVGEVITGNDMNYNNVYNLEQKFGGAKK